MNTCKNCNTDFTGKYCNNCGQKLFSAHDKSIKNLTEELFHFFTHFEGTFFTTIKTILSQPGRLTTDYGSGIRKKYYKPVSLYLLIVIIYLLFPLAKGLNMDMAFYKTNRIGTARINAQIEGKLSQSQLSESQLAETFEHKSEKVSKLLLFLLIPLAVVLLLLLFPKYRTSLYDLTILSTELNIFYISIFFLLLPLLIKSLSFLFEIPNPDNDYFVLFFVGSFFCYIYLLLKNFFHQQVLITLAKAILFTLLYLLLIQPLYKFLVFETTFLLL